MASEQDFALTSSFAAYGDWLQNQHIQELRYRNDGSLYVSFQVPVSWPTTEGNREPAKYFDFDGSVRTVVDTTGQESLVAEAHILRNFQELYEEVRDDRYNYSFSMFPKFYAWLENYAQHMQEYGVVYDPQLFSSVFQALDGTYDMTELKQSCMLDFLLSSDEGSRSKQNLSIGWNGSMNTITPIYMTIAQHPDLWEQAGIGGVCGDWDAFVQYMIVDIRTSWERVMPILADAAAQFSVQIAPQIVYEAMLDAHARGVEDTSFIPYLILGHQMDEDKWFQLQMRRIVDEYAQNDPLMASLTEAGSMRYIKELRPAMDIFGDRPLADMPHFVGTLDIKGSRNGKKIEFLRTEEGLIAEVRFFGNLDTILKYGPQLLNDWDTIIPAGAYRITPHTSTIDLLRGDNGHLVLRGHVSPDEQPFVGHMLYWMSELAPAFAKLVENIESKENENEPGGVQTVFQKRLEQFIERVHTISFTLEVDQSDLDDSDLDDDED